MSFLLRIEAAIEDLDRWRTNRARKHLNNRSLDKAIGVLEEARRREQEEFVGRAKLDAAKLDHLEVGDDD